MESLVTIVIPTENRCTFFKQSLQSILHQTFTDFQVIIKDSSTNDDVKNFCQGLDDHRIHYMHLCSTNIVESWNVCLELSNSSYISIFHDDDIMHPEFIGRSINALEKHPSAGMSYTQANKVDIDLKYISIWSDLCPGEGLIKGTDYLRFTVDKGCCVTIAPSVMLRKSSCNNVGNFVTEICLNSFDFNYWIRMANKYDIFFIREILVSYRLHEGQMSQIYWRQQKAKGRLATMLELQRAIYYLHQKEDFVSDLQNVSWLVMKADEYNRLAARYAIELIRDL